jgi:hypothetical protein
MAARALVKGKVEYREGDGAVVQWRCRPQPVTPP